MTSDQRPTVGVAVVVEKNGLLLLGKDVRKGDAIFGVPGGHWETGETLRECAAREVQEESGVICSPGRLLSVFDFYRADKQKSYVSIGFHALYQAGELTDRQSEGRCAWHWYTPEEAFALHLFAPDRILLERFLSGEVYV